MRPIPYVKLRSMARFEVLVAHFSADLELEVIQTASGLVEAPAHADQMLGQCPDEGFLP